jgi:hypothetical protein
MNLNYSITKYKELKRDITKLETRIRRDSSLVNTKQKKLSLKNQFLKTELRVAFDKYLNEHSDLDVYQYDIQLDDSLDCIIAIGTPPPPKNLNEDIHGVDPNLDITDQWNNFTRKYNLNIRVMTYDKN